MLKPLVLAAALTVGCSTMAAATPISSSRTIVTDIPSVSWVRLVRDKAPGRSPYRNSVIVLSMGFLVSLIVAAVVMD